MDAELDCDGWLVFPGDPPHVVPVGESHQQLEDCVCEPEYIDGVVVHRSFDCREHYENGSRKPH